MAEHDKKHPCNDSACRRGGSGGAGGCSGSMGHKPMNRRAALKSMIKGAAVTAGVACSHTSVLASDKDKETRKLEFENYFKKNYRLMTDEERRQTVERLERLARLKDGINLNIKTTDPVDGVLFGYAFNIGKCDGYMDCIKACVEENNQDRESRMQYIKIFEKGKGDMRFESAEAGFYHEVPAEGKLYMGVQCFQCENPPCTKVCPVGATWKEKDGIVVVDYDWCIGCRYCQAACPYFGRRFNWNTPVVPKDEVNTNQHYLGNRIRNKGSMEKCTFCISRSRDGKNPACVDACPNGARIFGNLLDPNSEIRFVLANKKVFRLKEELDTEPKFWYFMD